MLKKRIQMAFKQEATPGTAEALSNTYAAINCFNISFPKQNYNMQAREQQGSFTRLPAISGARTMTIEFDTEVVGTSATGLVNPILSDLICCCGYSVTAGVFTPISDSSTMTSVTAGIYMDGKRRLLAGCSGNFTITTKNGERSMFHFTLTGKPAPDTDTAILSVTYPTIIPPRGCSALSVNSVTTLRAATLTFDSGSVPKMLETVINDTNSTGYAFGIISDRMTKLTIDPEATTVATVDWETLQNTPTQFAASYTIGAGSNMNSLTIAAIGTAAQVMDRSEADREGVITENLPLAFNQGATLTFN